MLKKLALIGLGAAAPLMIPGVAHAQNAAQNGVLLIYGNDKCPTNDNGDEIVVCQRLEERERFRIPENLREATRIAPQNQSWAVRQQGALEANQVGTGSCTAIGAGGTTGCFVKEAKKAKAEARQRRDETVDLPLP